MRTTRVSLAKPQATNPLSPAERTAQLLAFRPGQSHSFAPMPAPAKPVTTASSRFATA